MKVPAKALPTTSKIDPHSDVTRTPVKNIAEQWDESVHNVSSRWIAFARRWANASSRPCRPRDNNGFRRTTICRVTHLALDNACSDAERDERAQLAAKHPQLIVESVGEIFTHTLLEWQSEDISECMKLELAASAHDQLKVPRATTALRPTRRLLWRFAAAILLIAIGFGSWQIAGIRLRNSPIAEIIAQDDLTWTSNSTALRDGNLIVPGRLENRTGSFTLKFRSGPIVRIAGQTSLDINSAPLVYLERGQATARVPESGKGFAIKTQEAKVVDQGTEFGVFAPTTA